MGRVREHEVGGGARLLATALSSGVLLVGILGWMVAVGTMASGGGGGFGENVVSAPSASSYASLGAAASSDTYETRTVRNTGVNGDARRSHQVDMAHETSVRRAHREDGGGARARPATDWDARGRKHAWLAEHGGAAHLASMDWSASGTGQGDGEGDTTGGPGEDEWDLGSVSSSAWEGDDGEEGEGRDERVSLDTLHSRVSLDALHSKLAGDITTTFTWSGKNLPKLGQDVATGERRVRGAAGSTRSKDSAEKTNGVTPADTASWYDPAFVDAELEYRTRSGRDTMVEKFLNPPSLNYTSDTGRLRRLGRTLYLDGKVRPGARFPNTVDCVVCPKNKTDTLFYLYQALVDARALLLARSGGTRIGSNRTGISLPASTLEFTNATSPSSPRLGLTPYGYTP
jgi:hypothetical protein